MAELEERYDLITRNLQEVLGGDIIKAILAEGKNPKCYWGTPFCHPHRHEIVCADHVAQERLPLGDVSMPSSSLGMTVIDGRDSTPQRILAISLLWSRSPISCKLASRWAMRTRCQRNLV